MPIMYLLEKIHGSSFQRRRPETTTEEEKKKKTMNECNQWLAECVLSLWLNWNQRESSAIEHQQRQPPETTVVNLSERGLLLRPPVLTWCLP